jgi:tagatose-6-phosphate ketose/aldose isomerase
MTVNPREAGSQFARLLARPMAEQVERGYRHTLTEIVQQPGTWIETAGMLTQAIEERRLRAALEPLPNAIVLTGSGSSLYVGECLATGLQTRLNLPVQAIAAGTLLTHWRGTLPPGQGLLVSFARSGNSPESCAVIDTLLAEAPQYRHLIITCNARGRLATRYGDEVRVTSLILDDRTNDRSLVMTSSFTNLVLAGRALAWLEQRHEYRERTARLAAIARHVLEHDVDALAEIARRDFTAVIYLGSGGRFGSAREAALKMLEMSAGRVKTMAETYLGLRHGPMSAVDASTLVVGFLSSEPAVRAYECDVLRELARKGLGAAKVLVGENIVPNKIGTDNSVANLLADGDLVVEAPGLSALGDEEAPPIDVLVGQLLAFFNCLHLDFKPDAPSQGVLTRVVEDFRIYRSPA